LHPKYELNYLSHKLTRDGMKMGKKKLLKIRKRNEIEKTINRFETKTTINNSLMAISDTMNSFLCPHIPHPHLTNVIYRDIKPSF